MDHTRYCCAHEYADQSAEIASLKEKQAELETLLKEATQLLFVQGDKPSKALFAWWYRRYLKAA